MRRSTARPCVGRVAKEFPEVPEDGARSAAGVAARRHVEELLQELQDSARTADSLFLQSMMGATRVIFSVVMCKSKKLLQREKILSSS